MNQPGILSTPIRRPGSTLTPTVVAVQIVQPAPRRITADELGGYALIAIVYTLTAIITTLICVGPFVLVYLLALQGL